MARKRKKMTITQLYNRTAKGLLFFGEVIAEKKRATKKQLNALRKLYKNIRKAEREKGTTDLPTIAQAAKYVEEQPIIQTEVKEPLPYAEDETYNEIPEIDYASPVIDGFMDSLHEAVSEMLGVYATSPAIVKAVTDINSQIVEKIHTLREKIGDENLATQLEQSIEYDALNTITKYSYNEAIGILDNILSDLQAILKDIEATQEPTQFVPSKTINFDNI